MNQLFKTPNSRFIPLAIAVAVLLVSWFWSSQESTKLRNVPDIHRLSGLTMGTSFDLQIVEQSGALGLEVLSGEVDTLLYRLDKQIFSTYEADSELSRLNQHAVDTPFSASKELIELLLLSQEVSELTEGAFDVTVGPLVNMWGFGPENRPENATVPGYYHVNAVLQRVGFSKISIDPVRATVKKTDDVYIDLSAIAKGYAVDAVAGLIDSSGFENYFIEIGGELKIKGLKPRFDAQQGELTWLSWVPAVERPENSAPQVHQVLYSNGDTIALAGSGDYRNYFEQDGVRYSHEIDPRTGYPIRHNLAAAYVIDSSAARADALATAYMVLGAQAGQRLAQEQRHAVYFITKDASLEDQPDAQAQYQQFASDEFKYYLSEID